MLSKKYLYRDLIELDFCLFLCRPEELEKVALSTLKDYHLDDGHYHPQILIARDTRCVCVCVCERERERERDPSHLSHLNRPSSEKLVQIIKDGLDLLTTNYTDYGIIQKTFHISSHYLLLFLILQVF